MNSLDSRSAGIWLSVLSLDVVAPFLNAMLVPAPSAFLTGPLRVLILENRNAVLGQPLPSNLPLLRSVIAQLNTVADDVGSRFERWLTYVATVSWNERPAWAHWSTVIQEWSVGKKPGVLLAAPWFQEMCDRYLELTQSAEWRARTEEARRGPLTAWDAHMFAVHRYYEIDEEDDGYDPFLPVRNTISFIQLRRFHSEMMSRLQASDRASLTAAAKETARRINYPQERAIPFDDLRDL